MPLATGLLILIGITFTQNLLVPAVQICLTTLQAEQMQRMFSSREDKAFLLSELVDILFIT